MLSVYPAGQAGNLGPHCRTMPENTADVPSEVRAQVEADVRRMLVEMTAGPNRRPEDSPLDVPVDVLVDAELRLRRLAGRRLTAAEAEAIDGPPYDET